MAILPGMRIRDNGIVGETVDNPLTAGATVMNSANLFRLSVVSGNHAIITLDPLREHGEPEIVMVTAHSAAATAATIQRGMYGTIARSHPAGTTWVHAATNDDFELITTSGSRPTDVWKGQVIYETDTARTMRHTGAAWVQDGLNFDPPACRVYSSVTQNLPDATDSVLTFDSERFDTDSMHSTTTLPNRITMNTAGIYIVSLAVEIIGAADYLQVYSSLRVNGSVRIALNMDTPTSTVTAWPNLPVTAIWKFSAGDYVEAMVYQDNSANQQRHATNVNGYGAELSAVWVGRGN